MTEPADEHEWWWPTPGRVGAYHAEPPPDHRRVDPEQAARLRDLYAQAGWRGEEADFAVLRHVYAARIDRGRIWVPSWECSQDTDRFREPVGPARHYVTNAGINRPHYTTSLDAAARLLRSALPQFGYRVTQSRGGSAAACLMFGDVEGAGSTARSAPLALLAAIMDELSRDPDAAAARREP